MSTKTIKQHIRKTKTGKTVIVRSHQKSFQDRKEATNKLAKKRISDSGKAKEIISKYGNYPSSLRVMVDGKWKSVMVKRWRVKTDGSREQYQSVERHLDLDNTEWKNLINENAGLINKIVLKYNWKPEFQDDLKAVAIKSMFEAANNYESKYDPSNPPDIQKHFSSQINGNVRAELAKQMATKIRLPAAKQVLYSKFVDAYDKHGGDFNNIYDDLKIKKKDLYPAIDPMQGEQPLPREGYVSVTKEQVLKDKVDTHQEKMNKLHNDYEDAKAGLHSRAHIGTDEDKRAYSAAIKVMDQKIDALNARMDKESDVSTHVDIVNKITDIESRKEVLASEIQPLGEASYERELESLKGDYGRKVSAARDKFNKEVGKTTIQGTDALFREFEQIMSFKDVNLSKNIELGNGEGGTLEEITRVPNQTNPEQEMIIKTEYVRNLDKFMDGINSLDEKTSKIVRMHLGLDETNEPYAHGLWGVPMESAREIARSLPDGFYKPKEVETGEFAKRSENWNKSKPAREQTIKRSEKEVAKKKAELAKWEARRDKARKEISKNVSRVDGSAAKQSFREAMYRKHKSTLAEKPTDIKTKKITLSDKEYQEALNKWKERKPNGKLSENRVSELVTKDLEIGKRALSHIVPRKVYRDLMDSYSDMRAYNIRKSHLLEDLRKSLIVDAFLGYKLNYVEDNDNLVLKAFKKIKEIGRKLFGGFHKASPYTSLVKSAVSDTMDGGKTENTIWIKPDDVAEDEKEINKSEPVGTKIVTPIGKGKISKAIPEGDEFIYELKMDTGKYIKNMKKGDFDIIEDDIQKPEAII